MVTNEFIRNIRREDKARKFIEEYVCKSLNPRIGGSCALWAYGDVDTFDDVDILVDMIPENPEALFYKCDGFEFLPLKHEKRLNDSIRIKFDGEVYDIHESIMPPSRSYLGGLEPKINIYMSRKILKRFFSVAYGENIDKWNDIKIKYSIFYGKKK